jgi:hypothetical protein
MEPGDRFLVVTTVVTCKSAKICLRSGIPRPLQYDSRLPPLSPVQPKVNITQQGYDPHPNHSAPIIATSQGCSHTLPKTLLDLQKAADEKGDSARSAVILEILTHKQERKKWRQINHTTCLPRRGAPIMLQVQAGQTINTYSMEHEMFEHTSDHLSQWFRLAHSAPCYQGQLFDDLGFMGDTKCAQKILEGMYDYPPDTDKWTKKILQEAHFTFSQKMSGIEIATMITTEDFQNYWQPTGNEWMKGLCHLSAESRILIIKQQPSIICSWQCMRRISQHAQGKAFP